MRRVPIVLTLAVAVFTVSFAVSGCGAEENEVAVPVIDAQGSQQREYGDLDALAERASAIVLVQSTGERSEVPFPAAQGGSEDSAPTEFYTLEVIEVLSGSVDGDSIEVVTPGVDQNTGKSALEASGEMILFITPAMYAADEPVGGYAIVGGPAGMYVKSGDEFHKVDRQMPNLPESVDAATTWPKISKSEAQLLHGGP